MTRKILIALCLAVFAGTAGPGAASAAPAAPAVKKAKPVARKIAARESAVVRGYWEG